MRDASRPRRRSWNLDEWGLRWKVLAVLAVPLIVAMVLGSMRVLNAYNESNRLSAAADHVARVPAAVQLEAAAGTVIGGQESNTVTDADIAQLKTRIDEANTAASGSDAIPEVSAALRRMTASAQKVVDGGKNVAQDLAAMSTLQHQIQADSVVAVEATVKPIEDNDVVSTKTQLVDALTAQARLFDEVTAGIVILRNPKDPGLELSTASAAERALVDSLARDYPKDDASIADLYKGLDSRAQLISQGQASGQFPLLELRESLLASLSTYADLISIATKSIISTVNDRADSAKTAVYRDAAISLGTLLLALALAYLVARSLLSPLRRLRRGALQVAEYDLPDAVERIKAGESIDDFEFAQVPVHTSEEIGQVARAVDDIHGQAIRLAGEQAHLRLQINDMFETLARRTKTLVDHQLRLIEDMEYSEKDPKLLDSLFRLDHVAARMRRNGDNLLILAGTRVRRAKSAPVNLVDVLRAAVSEVEDYRRVKIGATPDIALSGGAARDVAHLVAELLDNALRASPPSSDVTFSYANTGQGGTVLEVADRGIGIPPDEMAMINDRLEMGAEVSPDTARRMGLFVVSKLAERHGMRVRLRPTFDAAREPGVTVSVHIPDSLIVAAHAEPGANVFADATEVVEQSAPTQVVPQVPTGGAAPAAAGTLGALPQRRPGTTDVPQRQAAAPSIPQRQPVPQRQPIPQRQPAAPAAASASATGLVASGLPQRQPGSALPSQQRAAADARPVSSGTPIGDAIAAAQAAGTPVAESLPSRRSAAAQPDSDVARHRYRTNPVKTASFFQSRIDRPDPPIFAELSSNWLDDPAQMPRHGGAWESAGDDGWDAARRAAQVPVDARTGTGLPVRQPGNRLVPGGVGAAAEPKAASTRGRDPDAIRANLSRHQQGVRNGRALRTTDTTDEGQR
ncbi:sensor histidine kinase [Antrihabitans cavernicola]|uniref:histidine kinase n=1 Tax=Antrihabitans cavernicola TaxID=2495913 RepID=A0A5A7SHS6_9NOCA|nr:ATP-binding protein [Spelaeibacter cavernicola]KAA0024277.1 sensor histidine kinase [Spelaeibacter cavernicola]